MSQDYPRVPIEDLQSFRGRAKHLYVIQDKNGVNRPFEFIQTQDILNNIVQEEYKRTKKEFGHAQCRLMVDKCRQFGGTTYSEILSLDQQIYDHGSNGVITAHDQDTTEKIYKIYKRAFDNLPERIVPTLDGEDMTRRAYTRYMIKKSGKNPDEADLSAKEYNDIQTIKIKPEAESYSGKRIGFKDTDSMTTIFTAGKGDTGGLGGTVRRAILSEGASYSKYQDLLTAMNPSIPKFAENVLYIIESTPNGTTGDGEGFYKGFMNAMKEWERYKKGEIQRYGGFRPVFIPWYMIEEYELPLAGGKYESIDQIDFGSPEEKRKFLAREEELLTKGIYNPLTEEIQVLTPEKINWYRWIIKKDCEYNYRSAQRFYPTTIEEGFLASSHCYFDSYKLNQRKSYLQNNVVEHERGELEWSEHSQDLEFVASSTGNLIIYKEPEQGWDNRYVIGADIAQGREEGDYSVAIVRDRFTNEIVARYYGRVDQDIFAKKISEMGLYYNEALLVVERNMSMVIELIKPDGLMPYIGELYFTETGRSIDYGFWTGGTSRNTLLGKYKAHLRDNPRGYDYLPDVDMVDEHISFVRHQTASGVKYEADEGSHDDMVIASSLAYYGDEWWDIAPEKYEPSKITEIFTRPARKRSKYIKQHQLGRSR